MDGPKPLGVACGVAAPGLAIRVVRTVWSLRPLTPSTTPASEAGTEAAASLAKKVRLPCCGSLYVDSWVPNAAATAEAEPVAFTTWRFSLTEATFRPCAVRNARTWSTSAWVGPKRSLNCAGVR